MWPAYERDIYLPDFKYWSAETSERYMRAADYPQMARAAIQAMHGDAGDPRVFALGLGPDTHVNLMDQYRPAGKVDGSSYVEINARDFGQRRLDERRPHPRLLQRRVLA